MNRYRQIIVHAGLSKTGTTSIQSGCESHCDFLRQQGIIYPQFHFDDAPLTTHSIPLVAAITGSPGKYGLRLRQRFPNREGELIHACKLQLERVLGSVEGHSLVLSTELIEGFDAEDLATLRATIAPHADRVRVIAYVRSPHSALESLLQERTRAGAVVDPDALVGRVRQKIENLQSGLGDWLEVVNFHEAAQHPHGLVGSFMIRLGLSEKDIAGLDFVSVNERFSMEAFLLMTAINRRYSRRDQDVHKLARVPGDLDALGEIPGPRFQLTNFISSDTYQGCLQEAAWLESHLNIRFPVAEREPPQPLWQPASIEALLPAIHQLQNTDFSRCIAEFLADEARVHEVSRPTTARQLVAISSQLMADRET